MASDTDKPDTDIDPKEIDPKDVDSKEVASKEVDLNEDGKVQEKAKDKSDSGKKKKSKSGEDAEPEEDTRTLKEKIVAEIPFLLKLMAFLLVFWTTIFGHYKIPSESMQPTLEVGDHLYVAKYAYGYSRHSLPLGLHHIPLPEGRIFSSLPERGDVVVFRHPYQKIVMIKRVVGLPGDTIRMKDGRLYVNNVRVERKEIDQRRYTTYEKKQLADVMVYEEQFEGEDEPHIIYERGDGSAIFETSDGKGVSYILPNDNTPLFSVPDNHVFFMGDNRDGSLDSRAKTTPNFPDSSGPGMVHMNYVIGRADLIMFSLHKCTLPEQGDHCASKRFFSKIK